MTPAGRGFIFFFFKNTLCLLRLLLRSSVSALKLRLAQGSVDYETENICAPVRGIPFVWLRHVRSH